MIWLTLICCLCISISPFIGFFIAINKYCKKLDKNIEILEKNSAKLNENN